MLNIYAIFLNRLDLVFLQKKIFEKNKTSFLRNYLKFEGLK